MSNVRVIAFYLPQFYPNPQNDEWWGKGFTEWTNVARATPKFPGHYQPHLPADLGFCDLRVAETRHEQAGLARNHGVDAFCYYHYWFHGDRMLERVEQEVAQGGEPDIPFCLCWANESWTRSWLGGEKDILMKQTYSPEDDLEHIRYLIKLFSDPRYIRINGHPLFLIYRAQAIKERLDQMLDIWNKELGKAGIPGLYLCCVRDEPPSGFDASINFFPNLTYMPWTYVDKAMYKLFKFVGSDNPRFKGIIRPYSKVIDHIIGMSKPDFKYYHCPFPNWDNTPRRPESDFIVLHDSSPQEFERWLNFAMEDTIEKFEGEERLLFINAWNEWGEGAHLEPDQKWGRAYLEALQRSIERHNGRS